MEASIIVIVGNKSEAAEGSPEFRAGARLRAFLFYHNRFIGYKITLGDKNYL